DKPVSRLAIGVDKFRSTQDLPTVLAVLDDYFERGGNCFDSAYIYAGGACEQILGDWIRTRGVRDQVIVVDKGAHSPDCTPEGITRQLPVSLERLGLDSVDVYM